MLFEFCGIHSVVSIHEAQNLPTCVSHGHVEMGPGVFHCFHKFSLEVPCFARFDRRINQTFASSHCVKEELLRIEAVDEGVLHESPGFGTVVVFLEMWQGAIVESIVHPLTLDADLADDTHHLQHVNQIALGLRLDHVQHPIVGRLDVRVIENGVSDVRVRLVRDIRNFIFEMLVIGGHRIVDHLVLLDLLHVFIAFLLHIFQTLANHVSCMGGQHEI